MTLENFRIAARSLVDFPGVIAIIGGNPTMHRNFREICRIFVEEIPNKNSAAYGLKYLAGRIKSFLSR